MVELSSYGPVGLCVHLILGCGGTSPIDLNLVDGAVDCRVALGRQVACRRMLWSQQCDSCRGPICKCELFGRLKLDRAAPDGCWLGIRVRLGLGALRPVCDQRSRIRSRSL